MPVVVLNAHMYNTGGIRLTSSQQAGGHGRAGGFKVQGLGLAIDFLMHNRLVDMRVQGSGFTIDLLMHDRLLDMDMLEGSGFRVCN